MKGRSASVAEAIAAGERAAQEILARDENPDQLTWQWPLHVARHLKGVIPTVGMNGQQLLSAAVIRAHELLAPELADDAYGDLENFATAVAAALPKVRYAVGEGPLDLAWRQSQAAPVIIADPGRGRRYRAFLSFAFRLQQARGEDAIFLPGRKVGALLGVSHVVVQAWIALAVGDGYLEVVDGTHRPGRARRFRFIGRVGTRAEVTR